MRNVSHTRQESPRLQPWGGSQESQTYLLEWGFGSERESRKEPVEMPYADCLFDGKSVEGDVIRHEDGSMELRVSRRCSENPRRISLFDGNAEPNPRIKPIEQLRPQSPSVREGITT